MPVLSAEASHSNMKSLSSLSGRELLRSGCWRRWLPTTRGRRSSCWSAMKIRKALPRYLPVSFPHRDRLQKEAGIEDSPELFAADLVAKTHDHTPYDQALAVARAAGR